MSVTVEVPAGRVVVEVPVAGEGSVAQAARAARDAAAASATQAAGDAEQTGQDRAVTTAAAVQAGQDRVATAADRVQTGLDRAITTADRGQTQEDRAAVVSAAAQVAVDAAQVTADAAVASQRALDAEAAADSASLSATFAATASPLYADVAAGLAAVSDGDAFAVEGDGGAFAVVYRRVGSDAVEVGRYPSAAALDAVNLSLIRSAAPSLDLLTIRTEAGQVLGRFRDGWDMAGAVRAPLVSGAVVEGDALSLGTDAPLFNAGPTSSLLWQVRTPDGRVTFRQRRDGVVEVPSLATQGGLTVGGAFAASLLRGPTVDFGDGTPALSARTNNDLFRIITLDGRSTMRQRRDGVVEVPGLHVLGPITAGGLISAPNIVGAATVPEPVAIPQAAIDAVNAAEPAPAPSGFSPVGPLSIDREAYGTRFAHLASSVAVTGNRVWAIAYGQNTRPGDIGEGPDAFCFLAYNDDFPSGTWREVLYILPGLVGHRAFDPIIYTMPDGRLAVMWLIGGVSEVGLGNGMAGFLIQNPEATHGAFEIGRRYWLDAARPEPPGVIGGQVYMVADRPPIGRMYWGRLTTPGYDGLAFERLVEFNTPPGPSGENINTAPESPFATLSGGRIQVWLRTTIGTYTTISNPGITNFATPTPWTPFPTPASRVAFGRSPFSGMLCGVFNNHPSIRRNLTLAISPDEGATWPWTLLLDGRQFVAYPYVTWDRQGRVVISYDYNRASPEKAIFVVRVSEEAVRQGNAVIERSTAFS
jgi:hypothetical protein